MQVAIGVFVAVLIGFDGPSPKGKAPAPSGPQVAGEAPTGPEVAFEIRDIRLTSPSWRGKLLPQLNPVDRKEGVAVWAVDGQAMKKLLDFCLADARTGVVQTPKMIARVGQPARMSSETAHKYVAHLERHSDGPPNEGSRIAFTPVVDEVHDGVRVNVLSSHLKGQALFAKVVVEENRLVAFHTTTYGESVKPKPEADPEVARTSLLSRLNPGHDPHGAAINATVQVPEVDSRRIEGEWLIPGEGGLVISMGPSSRRENAFKKGYEERLITITARPVVAGASTSTPEATAAQTGGSSPTSAKTR